MAMTTTQSAIADRRQSLRRELFSNQNYLLRQGILKLLAIKDSDVRILTLEQARDAVDKGLHSGGAFSATIPLVTLYYGGFMNLDIVDPTRRGQDLFTLSKGHAVAKQSNGSSLWNVSYRVPSSRSRSSRDSEL